MIRAAMSTAIRRGLRRSGRSRNNTPKLVVFLRRCFVLLIGFAICISANADVRDNVYSFGLATENIYLVNGTNGTVSSVFTGYPTGGGAATAAAAQRASDGVIFYIANFGNTNQPVFTWNPATPATAPVQIGTTGAGIPYIPRAAFSQSGVLYAVDTNTANLYTISQTTGAATVVGALSGVPTNLGGDIGFLLACDKLAETFSSHAAPPRYDTSGSRG